ncbi:hypothetical protein [Humibacter ginsenosidimutans]|uniref:Uncharacterized protein n=1 Tax=Humibacter ginsenosidimutans TaxID=2599293 RepID=A0A5B8M0R2_9MICO|nr:hypothetical protein [Humibacter ginsenosidimutans]QDZ13621.1 hypothetical protein FPZ11_01345 [Humibacter ginsenosidimutans]
MAGEDARGTDPVDSRQRASRGHTAAKAPMTLEEAERIERQYDRGTLDLSLPGTEEIVAEAHRVRLRAELWGAHKSDDRRRQAKGTVVVVCAFIVITVVGLVACLAVAY